MKKVYLLLAILTLSLAFVSCSKDNDDDPKFSIVGTWKHHALSRAWIFNANKTYEYYAVFGVEKKPSMSGTYKYDGAFITLDEGFPKEVQFSENGKEMRYDGFLYYRAE